MFYISDIFTIKPEKTLTDLQEKVYNTLEELEISYERVETDVAIFVQGELFEEILKTEIGAATVFSALIDDKNKIQIVFDSDVVKNEWYGCSDGVNTGYMKIRTKDILEKVMPYSKHEYKVITM